MAQWEPSNPGAGDVSQLKAIKLALDNATTKAESLAGSLQRVGEGLAEVWTGTSFNGWQAQVTTHITQLTGMAESCRNGSTAIGTYCEAVESIKDQVSTQKELKKQANSIAKKKQILCVESSMYDYEGAVYCYIVPLTVPDDSQGTAQDARNVQDDINAAAKAIHDLVQVRTDADAAASSAIMAAMPAGWLNEKAIYTAAGLTDPALMNPSALPGAMAEYAKEVAEQGGPLTEAQAKLFNDYFDLSGTDPEAMSQFYRKLGGENTAALIAALDASLRDQNRNAGSFTVEEIAALGGRFRETLAAGSAAWSEASAERFAKGLFANYDDRAAIGFLFDGPPYMGAELAVSAAGLIDKYEREDGRSYVQMSDLVTYFDQYFRGGDSHSGYDAAGRILETLGQYPDRASEFLADAKEGDARIDYWFGDRDWGLYDKFEGPMALWHGAQRVSGGPAEGIESYVNGGAYDEAAWQTAARLSSDIMDALFNNESFDVDSVSDRGSVSLAAAISYFLPYLTDETLFGDTDKQASLGDKIGNFSDTDLLSLNGSTRPTPNIGWDALAELLGVAGAHSGGAQVLVGAQNLYSDALKSIAENSNDPLIVGKAIERIAALDGFIGGAVAGTEIDSAARADQETQRQIDAVLDALGAVPVPGFGTVVSGVASTIVDGVVSYGLGELGESIADGVVGPHAEDGARETAEASRTENRETAENELLRTALNALGMQNSIPDYSDKEDSDWQRLWDQVNYRLNESGANNLDDALSEWNKAYSYGKDGSKPW